MTEKKAGYTTRRFYDPLDDVLDRPIAYNPAFRRICSSTVGALMLSQAWYWSKRTSDEDGWFYKTVDEWKEETGLTRSEQETARKHLQGFLEVEYRGMPAQNYYRVNKEEIYNALGIQIAETPRPRTLEPRDLDSAIPATINMNTENTPENTTDMGDVVQKANHKVDAMLDQVRKGEGKVSYPKREALPEPIRELIDEFVRVSGMKPLAKDVSGWLMAGQDWLNLNATKDDVRKSLEYAKGKFTISSPASLTNTIRSYKTGNLAGVQEHSETDSPVYIPPPENPNAMTYAEWQKSQDGK